MITNLKPYAEYKESGLPWLGQVPEHWEVIPNRALFNEVKERNYPEEEMLSVTITKGIVKQEVLLKESSKRDSSNLDRSAYKLVQPQDLAYNKMRAWQGAIGASTLRGIISPAYVVMRLRSADDLPTYFHNLYRTPRFAKEAERWSYGITSDMWSLRPEHFKMIYSPKPPHDEQAAIVRFLDWANGRLERAIRAKRKVIALLNEQKQAIIHRAVTRGLDPNAPLKPSGIPWLGEIPAQWDTKRLRHACDMRVSSVDKHTKMGETPVRLCNYVEVYRNERIQEATRFMAATATEDERVRFGLRKGDVLITKDSEQWDDIGVPALVECEAPDLVCGYHLAILRARAGLVGAFLHRTLESHAIAAQFHVEANGVTRYGLSHGAILNVAIPLPPPEEQEAIVRFLDKEGGRFADAISRLEREIALLREYRTRLIADVVTGKLDVREFAKALPIDEVVDPQAEDIGATKEDALEADEAVE